MSDDTEDGIYRFFKYANVDGKKVIVSEMSCNTMKELEEIVIDWIKNWKFAKNSLKNHINLKPFNMKPVINDCRLSYEAI